MMATDLLAGNAFSKSAWLATGSPSISPKLTHLAPLIPYKLPYIVPCLLAADPRL